MTDRTLRISARMAEEIQQWASDELSQWPRDTAYAADLENLLSQLTAAAPAPDPVARLVEAAQPVMWRARHSETEEWQHFNRRPSWREVQPLYAHPPQPSASVAEAIAACETVPICAQEMCKAGHPVSAFNVATDAMRALKGDNANG